MQKQTLIAAVSETTINKKDVILFNYMGYRDKKDVMLFNYMGYRDPSKVSF